MGYVPHLRCFTEKKCINVVMTVEVGKFIQMVFWSGEKQEKNRTGDPNWLQKEPEPAKEHVVEETKFLKNPEKKAGFLLVSAVVLSFKMQA